MGYYWKSTCNTRYYWRRWGKCFRKRSGYTIIRRRYRRRVRVRYRQRYRHRYRRKFGRCYRQRYLYRRYRQRYRQKYSIRYYVGKGFCNPYYNYRYKVRNVHACHVKCNGNRYCRGFSFITNYRGNNCLMSKYSCVRRRYYRASHWRKYRWYSYRVRKWLYRWRYVWRYRYRYRYVYRGYYWRYFYKRVGCRRGYYKRYGKCFRYRKGYHVFRTRQRYKINSHIYLGRGYCNPYYGYRAASSHAYCRYYCYRNRHCSGFGWYHVGRTKRCLFSKYNCSRRNASGSNARWYSYRMRFRYRWRYYYKRSGCRRGYFRKFGRCWRSRRGYTVKRRRYRWKYSIRRYVGRGHCRPYYNYRYKVKNSTLAMSSVTATDTAEVSRSSR